MVRRGPSRRVLSHPRLEHLRSALLGRAPQRAERDPPFHEAAVTLLLAPAANDLELLLMERAVREGDPWSGQVSLPGGRFDATDESLLATALRELREEAGVDVSPSQVLGELDELRPRIAALPSIIVRPYVATVDVHPPLTANDEAAALFWAPLSLLSDPARRVRRSVEARGLRMQVEGIDLGGRLLWGMTDRILMGLLHLLR